MTDRELLEMAAKAAGIKKVRVKTHTGEKEYYPALDYCPMSHTEFDPINHDGDAFRLACQLNMAVLTRDESTYVDINLGKPFFIPVGTNGTKNKHESARRCIVLAAAHIGSKL